MNAPTPPRPDAGGHSAGPPSGALPTDGPPPAGSHPRVVVRASGGVRDVGGPAGHGALVCDADTGAVLVERSGVLEHATVNVAEYLGLISGLRAAAELGAREVEVRMDSRLVVEQMAGRWRIRRAALRALAAQAAVLVNGFTMVRFGWVPRSGNRHAIDLVDQALAGQVSGGQALGGRVSGDQVPGGRPGVAHAPAAGGVPRSAEPFGGTPTRLILVRHAQTQSTALGRYSGHDDIPLSDLGRAQALALAGRLADQLVGRRMPDFIVSSPLLRATMTAEPIAKRFGMAVHIDGDLMECDFGAWEGLTFARVRQRWPAELTAWLDSPAVAPPGGESFTSVRQRARRAVDRLRGQYAGRTIILISHGSPIKLILQDALDGSAGFLHRLCVDAGGVSVLDFWPDGGVAVRTVNDTCHLADLTATGAGPVTLGPSGVDPDAGPDARGNAGGPAGAGMGE